MAEEQAKERRRHRRISMVANIECVYEGMLGKKPKQMMDLSVGGMFVDLLTPPPPGTIVNLKFQLVGYEDPVVVTGEVCYSQDGIGMGVKFLDLKPEDKEKIEKVIEKSK